MNIQSLEYIMEIAKVGSINKAAHNLYISQPHLSRILKEVEQDSNIIIFRRTRKGIELTTEGKSFIARVSKFLDNYHDMEASFFRGGKSDTVTLKVATQRYSPIIESFARFYTQYCIDKDYVNIALYEDTIENIIDLVTEQIYNVGVVHVLKDVKDNFIDAIESKGLCAKLIDESPIFVQINESHPLASKKEISREDLAPYPYISFVNENVSNISYWRDVQKFDDSVLKKRILVEGRGTLLYVLSITDAYYLGTDCSFAGSAIPQNLLYIPYSGSDDTILTYWLSADPQQETEYERALLNIYNALKE